MRNTQTNHSECRINVLFLANIRNLIKKKRSQRDVKKTTNQWYKRCAPHFPYHVLGASLILYIHRKTKEDIHHLIEGFKRYNVSLFVCLDKFTLIKRAQSFDFYFFRTPIRFYTENWGTIEPKQLTCTAELYNDTNVNLGTIEPVDRSIIKYTTMILVIENKRI